MFKISDGSSMALGVKPDSPCLTKVRLHNLGKRDMDIVSCYVAPFDEGATATAIGHLRLLVPRTRRLLNEFTLKSGDYGDLCGFVKDNRTGKYFLYNASKMMLPGLEDTPSNVEPLFEDDQAFALIVIDSSGSVQRANFKVINAGHRVTIEIPAEINMKAN